MLFRKAVRKLTANVIVTRINRRIRLVDRRRSVLRNKSPIRGILRSIIVPHHVRVCLPSYNYSIISSILQMKLFNYPIMIAIIQQLQIFGESYSLQSPLWRFQIDERENDASRYLQRIRAISFHPTHSEPFLSSYSFPFAPNWHDSAYISHGGHLYLDCE